MKPYHFLLALSLSACKIEEEKPQHMHWSEVSGLGSECNLRFEVSTDFEAGKQPQLAYEVYRLESEDREEKVEFRLSHGSEIVGHRILQSDKIRLSFSSMKIISLSPKPGRYRLDVLIDGAKTAEASLLWLSRQDKCPDAEDIKIYVASTEPFAAKSGFDYYPLNPENILEVETSNGSGFSGKREPYSEIEIVRELQKIFEGQNASGWKPARILEKNMDESGKCYLGSFEEMGVYRGEIIDASFEDSLVRSVFAKGPGCEPEARIPLPDLTPL